MEWKAEWVWTPPRWVNSLHRAATWQLSQLLAVQTVRHHWANYSVVAMGVEPLTFCVMCRDHNQWAHGGPSGIQLWTVSATIWDIFIPAPSEFCTLWQFDMLVFWKFNDVIFLCLEGDLRGFVLMAVYFGNSVLKRSKLLMFVGCDT